MTYRELAKFITEILDEEQLDQDVTIYDAEEDESFAVNQFETVGENDDLSDVLGAGHPYLIIRLEEQQNQ